MDIGIGLAKLMHGTNSYLPHGTPERELLDCWDGRLLMSSNFCRPPNNQTKFLEDVNYQLSSSDKKNLMLTNSLGQ